MVLRDYKGEIIISACRQLLYCTDALGAELSAVLDGLSLALQWCSTPLIIETDCLEIVKSLKNEALDRSVYTSMVEEKQTLLHVRDTCITHVKRSQNNSSHFMANYARIHSCTAVWHSSGPEGLATICHRDCNP